MSASFDDPNREAVGLPPIWSTGETPPARRTKSAKSAPPADPEPVAEDK